jgi:cell division protein FtsL
MAYSRKTLRKMAPVSWRLAKLIAEQQSVARKMKNLLPEIQRLEADSRALKNHSCIRAIEVKELDL